MNYKKSKVKIACAGAGKTYKMAEEILTFNKYNGEEKDIIAITYTNAARDNIYNNIYKQNLAIPTRVKISTIHSFLLEYIIYPYSNYILGKKYSKATSIPLSDNIAFKNKRISELENKQIVHNEKVFKLSKQIIVPYKKDNSVIKKRKEIVLEHLLSSICSISALPAACQPSSCLRTICKRLFTYWLGADIVLNVSLSMTISGRKRFSNV